MGEGGRAPVTRSDSKEHKISTVRSGVPNLVEEKGCTGGSVGNTWFQFFSSVMDWLESITSFFVLFSFSFVCFCRFLVQKDMDDTIDASSMPAYLSVCLQIAARVTFSSLFCRGLLVCSNSII